MRTQMEPLNVKIPEGLQEKIEAEAEKIGITKSEKVRFDLIEKYY